MSNHPFELQSRGAQASWRQRFSLLAILAFRSLLLGSLTLLLGCGSLKNSGAGRIDQLHLLGAPVAIDLDKLPGADGLGVRIYASSARNPEAVRIASGSLELQLFDGTVRADQIASVTPLVTLSYSVSQLRTREYKTAVGISYNFVPAWGDHPPTRSRVTVVAIYTDGAGTVVRSAPVSVPLPGSKPLRSGNQ